MLLLCLPAADMPGPTMHGLRWAEAIIEGSYGQLSIAPDPHILVCLLVGAGRVMWLVVCVLCVCVVRGQTAA